MDLVRCRIVRNKGQEATIEKIIWNKGLTEAEYKTVVDKLDAIDDILLPAFLSTIKKVHESNKLEYLLSLVLEAE